MTGRGAGGVGLLELGAQPRSNSCFPGSQAGEGAFSIGDAGSCWERLGEALPLPLQLEGPEAGPGQLGNKQSI